MIAAALTLGALVVWWRPRLLLIAALVVFGTLDLIALGLAQRGLDLRTVVERLEFWRNGLLLAGETPFTGVGLGVSIGPDSSTAPSSSRPTRRSATPTTSSCRRCWSRASSGWPA